MSMRTAVVTMAYNEDVFLPLWLRYYTRQFGEASCYVIDHGSDDGSTDKLGDVNIVRIPRSPMHDKKRANFISNFCSALLEWYDVVIYTDIDEFLLPDPDVYPSLREFTDSLEPGSTVTAIGLNLTHLPDQEPDLDFNLPILEQRRWVRFAFSMCKPLVSTVPINWTPGFHSSQHQTMFRNLYLFHFHHFNLATSLKRLQRTRAMPWGDGAADHYQRWSDEKHEQVERAISQLPRIDNSTLREDDVTIGPRLNWIKEFVASNPEKKNLFYFQNGIACDELLYVPDRFLGLI
jgi:hypothetical protein